MTSTEKLAQIIKDLSSDDPFVVADAIQDLYRLSIDVLREQEEPPGTESLVTEAAKEPQTDEITEEWLESVGASPRGGNGSQWQTKASIYDAVLRWFPPTGQVRIADLEYAREVVVVRELNRTEFTELAKLLSISLEK